MVLPKAGACFAVALLLAGAQHGFAQFTESPSPPQAQLEPQTGTATTARSDKASQPTESRRQSKRSRRTSKRRPPSPAANSIEGFPRNSQLAGPTTQGLMLTSNTFVGYDDNVAANLGTGSGFVPTAMASGSIGNFDAALIYRRRNDLRTMTITSSGSILAYPGNLEDPAPGGTFDFDGWTSVGRDLRVGLQGFVRYAPVFSVYLADFSSALLTAGTSDIVPATGLYKRDKLDGFMNVDVVRRWTPQDLTWLSYSYRAGQYSGQEFGDYRGHDVSMQYRRVLARRVTARGQYRFITRDRTASDGAPLTTRDHRLEGGPEIEKALSRDRYLRLSVSAGAAYHDSLGSASHEPYSYWVPLASAAATLAVSPFWSAQVGYQRAFSVLQGVTDDVYTTDTAYAATGGLVATRTNLWLGGTYSNSRTPSASGVDDAFRVYGASVQLSVALNKRVAATAGYYYYHHLYSDPGSLASGFPGRYDRHSFRVGVALGVPLSGTEHGWGTSLRAPLTPR